MAHNLPNWYSELIQAGRAVYAEQIRSIESNSNPPAAPFVTDAIQKAMREDGHPKDGYVFIQVDNSGSFDAAKDQTAYQNYIHKDGKVIMCMNNYAERDHLAINKHPNRIFWSDIMAECFHRVVAYHGGDLKSLKAIWRVSITNPVTVDVIDTIIKIREPPVTLTAGEDGFFALLATVHGKGPARMLGSYPNIFGRKYISRAQIVSFGGMPSFYWVLEEMPPLELPPSHSPSDDRPLSRKERRHLKKLSRSSAAE